MDDDVLRLALSAIEPRGCDLPRRYLIADQEERDALALRLLHEGTEHGVARGPDRHVHDVPGPTRRVVRLVGELEAKDPS